MSSNLPKNELENTNFCPSLLGQKFFVRFLGELKKTKKPLGIDSPLIISVHVFELVIVLSDYSIVNNNEKVETILWTGKKV